MLEEICNRSAISVSEVLKLVGNTPTVKLKKLFDDKFVNVYAKLELLNPGGSLKDRTSAHMIQTAFNKGLINTETTIIESTSGNMGVGLAQSCLMHNLNLVLVIDPLINKATEVILRSYGARLVKVD